MTILRTKSTIQKPDERIGRESEMMNLVNKKYINSSINDNILLILNFHLTKRTVLFYF